MDAKPSLSLYSFSEMWHPALIIVLAGIAVLYFLLIRRWRGYFTGSAPVPKANQFYFMAGLLLYYAVEGSPWKVLGAYSFSAHMIGMTIAYLAVPPLILLGIPRWFWKPVLHRPVLKKVLKFFTQPILAVIAFNMLFSFDHIPLIFNWVAQWSVTMALAHYILLVFAFFMWWPVITPLPEMRQLSYLQKFGYLLLDGMLLTPACALLAFSNHLVYEPYFGGPQLLWYLKPVWDQQASGVFMKAIQEICYGTALMFVVYKWATTERKQRNQDGDPFAASARSRMMKPKESEN